MSILLVYSLLLQQPQPKSRSSKNFGRYWGRCVSQCFCYLFWLGSALCVNFFHLIEWPTILISRVGVFHYCNSVVQKIPPLYWYKEKKKKRVMIPNWSIFLKIVFTVESFLFLEVLLCMFFFIYAWHYIEERGNKRKL